MAFELTFQDVPTLQLLDIGSLAQPPAEKHQNHVLNHFDSQCPPVSPRPVPSRPVLFKPAGVSSLCAFSRGIPYVSISHPNRGCGASAEALPTSGTTNEARGLRFDEFLHPNFFKSLSLLDFRTPPCRARSPARSRRSPPDHGRFSAES